MAVKLAPGGKVVMVLLGVGLIGYGLWLGGVFGSDGDASGPEETADTAPSTDLSDQAGAARGPDGATGDAAGVPADDAAAAPSDPDAGEADEAAPAGAGEDGPAGDAPAGDGGERAAAPPPPPLLAEAPEPLRAGPDGWWDSPSDPRQMLRDLRDGKVDLVAVELHHLVQHGRYARSAAVIGALPPAQPLALCADRNPVEALRPGSRVGVGEPAHHLLVAHVAEVKGIGASAVEFVLQDDPSAEILVLDHIPEERVCFSLAAMGAQGPRILLGRLEDVRLYGKSYLEAAKARGALEPPARSYVAASPDDTRGYTRHVAYLVTLWSGITSLPEIPAPVVARWIVEEEP